MRPLGVFLSLSLLLTLGMVPGLQAEEREDHRARETKPSTSKESSSPTSVPLTRRQALIRGMREIQLTPAAVRDLVRVAEENPKLSPKKFGELVESLAEVDGTLTKDQADQVSELFQAELGAVSNGDVGKEFAEAARALLPSDTTAQTTQLPPVEKERGALPDPTNAPQSPTAGNALLGSSEPLDSVLNNRLASLEKQLSGKAGTGTPGVQDLLSKQLEATQGLLKNLEQNSSRRERGNGLNGGLLDALRAAIADSKNGKGEQGNSSGGDDLASSLKNALTHQPPPPPPRGSKGDEETNKAPPPRTEPQERPRESLAGLFKNGGNGNQQQNNNDKNGKNQDKFELPPSKSKDELSASKKDGKTADNALLSKNDNPADVADPSELMKALAKGAGQPEGNKSPLPPVAGGGFGGGGFGADPFGGGGFGGGGTMGPNIVGSASAPGGGGFDGDPFSNLGNGGGGEGAPPGGYNFAKPVAYGGGGGSEGGGDSGGDDDTVDGGGQASYGSGAKGIPLTAMLALTSQDDEGQPKSLIDYFGKLRGTLCGKTGGQVAVCQKLAGKRFIERLQKNAKAR